METLIGTLSALIVLSFIGVVFFLPSIIAFIRKIEYPWMVLAINIVCGGTGIVWLVLLFWSMTAESKDK